MYWVTTVLLLSHPSLFSQQICLNAASPSSFVLHIMSFTFPSFRKAPHSPSPSIAPLSSFLRSFTTHPPSVVALVPLLIQLSVCDLQHCFFCIKTHSRTLLSLIVLPCHRVLLPGKKKTTSLCGSCGHVSFYCLAAYLPLNCLRIYNLAWHRAACVWA